MARTIHKYVLGNNAAGKLLISNKAKIRSVQMQHGRITIWAEIDEYEHMVEHSFRIFGTGWKIPDEYSGEYLATVQDGNYVWHLFRDVA